jgi:uncharacterized protein
MNVNELYEWMLVRDSEDWDLNYIKRKVDEGIDIDSPLDEVECSLINICASENRLDIAKILFNAGASVDPLIEGGDYPLSSAAREGFQDIFDYLAPLTLPEERRLATMEIPGGIRRRARELDMRDDFTKAAGKSYLEFIENLSDDNEDVNIIGENGCTFIWTAAHNGHLEAVQALINAGANVNIKNRTDGWSPLMIAALTHQAWSDGTAEAWGENRSRQIDIVRLLIESGADVNATNNEGNTLLSLARQEEYTDIVQIMEDAGAVVL